MLAGQKCGRESSALSISAVVDSGFRECRKVKTSVAIINEALNRKPLRSYQRSGSFSRAPTPSYDRRPKVARTSQGLAD